jgi:hypothetical protein
MVPNILTGSHEQLDAARLLPRLRSRQRIGERVLIADRPLPELGHIAIVREPLVDRGHSNPPGQKSPRMSGLTPRQSDDFSPISAEEAA